MSRCDASSVPAVIQGGMGVAVSSWPLARAVAATGQLGVVSGTALDVVLARRLQDGDPGGHARAAMAAFPVPEVAAHVLDRYFRAGGREPGQAYAPVPRLSLRKDHHAQELAGVANFADDRLARHEPVSLPVDVIGASDEQRHTVDLDPVALLGTALPPLPRPVFLAIIAAHVLAEYLARDPGIRPDGFVVEGPPAGGHNAPPRGRLTRDDDGQPRYGPRDDADLARLAAIGLPFWLAGAYGTPARLKE